VRVVYRTAAGNDAEEARRWYEEQQPGLGGTFQEELARAETLLTSHPAAFPTVHRDYRRLVLYRFPDAVYYRRLDEETVEVVAVLHQRQSRKAFGRRP
jgi:plasmid stabilization system protein ParE